MRNETTFEPADIHRALQLLVQEKYGPGAKCGKPRFVVQPGDRPGEDTSVMVAASVTLPERGPQAAEG